MSACNAQLPALVIGILGRRTAVADILKVLLDSKRVVRRRWRSHIHRHIRSGGVGQNRARTAWEVPWPLVSVTLTSLSVAPRTVNGWMNVNWLP